MGLFLKFIRNCRIVFSADSPIKKPFIMEETFIAIKPEGVQRGLCWDVIRRFESKGYKMVACKLMTAPRPFLQGLVGHMSSGPVLAMVWSGKDVITASRAMIGATNPTTAAPGTIRGDLALDTGRNIVHGSDGPESAKREIGLWFTPTEKNAYESCMQKQIYE